MVTLKESTAAGAQPIGSSRKRLSFLDGFRGVACVGVVIYHYANHEEIVTGLGKIWCLGAYGVHLFFLISGFVIALSIEKYRDHFFTFLKSRAVRIYPTFFLAVLLSWVCLSLLQPNYDIPFSNALKNLLFFHRPLGVKHIDPAYWTLMQEWIFYVWIALFSTLSYRLKIPLVRFTTGMLLCLTGVALLERLNVLILSRTVRLVILHEYFYLFSAGIFLYLLYQNRLSKLLFTAGMALCALNFKMQLPQSKPQFQFSASTEGWIVLSIVGLFLIALESDRIQEVLSHRWLIFLGFISYPLYLFHNQVGQSILDILKRFDIPVYVRLPVVVSLFIVTAYIITCWYDEPTRKYLKRRITP